MFDHDGTTEGVRLSASGNSYLNNNSKLGIGTSNPGSPLHISGTSGSVAGSAILFNGSTAIWQPSDATLTIRPSGTDAATFTNSSTTFAGKIIAEKGVNYTGGTIAQATTVLHTNNIVYNIGGSNGIILSNYDYSERYYITNTDHRWEVGSADKMRLTSTGLGIGTTSPGHKLNVAGANNSTAVGIDIGSNAKFDFAANSTSAYATTFNMDDTGLDIGHDSTSRALNLKTGGADRLTILGGGNVGIGTVSPSYKLDVVGDVRIGSSFSSQKSLYFGDTNWSIRTENDYGSSTLDNLRYAVTDSSSSGHRFTNVNNDELLYIKGDGSGVGIGTTSPTYKLSVPSGGIEAGGKITYSKSAGSLNATGYAVAGITAAANGNGSSCGFTFTCFGHTGAYQRIVYSCYNGSGTWYAKKVIDEGTNQLDVAASANGSTITFTFKATSSSMYYTPRVTVEATGHNINSTYA